MSMQIFQKDLQHQISKNTKRVPTVAPLPSTKASHIHSYLVPTTASHCHPLKDTQPRKHYGKLMPGASKELHEHQNMQKGIVDEVVDMQSNIPWTRNHLRCLSSFLNQFTTFPEAGDGGSRMRSC